MVPKPDGANPASHAAADQPTAAEAFVIRTRRQEQRAPADSNPVMLVRGKRKNPPSCGNSASWSRRLEIIFRSLVERLIGRRLAQIGCKITAQQFG